MMKKFIPFIMAVFMAIPLLAQQTVVLGDVDDAVPGQIIEVPLYLNDFDNVGAITLEIAYDGNLIVFSEFVFNISGIPIPIVGFQNNRLSLQWFHQPGFSFDGPFGKFRFIYNGFFSGTLDFIETDCEIVNIGFVEFINIEYEGANVSQDPTLTPDGEATIGDANAIAGSIVQLPVSLNDLGGFDGVAKNLIFRLGYDNTKLDFKGIETIHLHVDDAIVDGKLFITNYNLPDDLFENYNDETLFYLEFEYWGGGSAAVDFLPGSIITDGDTDILVTEFGKGVVQQEYDDDHGSLTIAKYLSNGAVSSTLDPSIIVPDPVELTITAEGLGGINNMELVNLVIAYDKEKLLYIGAPTAPGGWTINEYTDGLLTITKADESGFTINDGVLLTLDFHYLYLGPYDPANDYFDSQADVTFEVGTYLLKTDVTPIGPKLIDGWVRLVLPGDANCDGIVSASDIVTIVNYINGLNPMPFCFRNADTNNDGIISAQDIVNVVNIIQNQ